MIEELIRRLLQQGLTQEQAIRIAVETNQQGLNAPMQQLMGQQMPGQMGQPPMGQPQMAQQPMLPLNAPQGQANLTEDQLGRMSFDEVLKLRELNPAQAAQGALAPVEHQAFMREFTQENPVLGAALGTVGNAGYETLKAMPDPIQDFAASISPKLDVRQSRSGPSMENFKGGLLGTLEGLGLGGPGASETSLRKEIIELSAQLAAAQSPQMRQQLQREIEKKNQQLAEMAGAGYSQPMGM